MMYMMLTDETNKKPSENVNFFVYGGLIIPLDKLVDLDLAIGRIRNLAKFHLTDEFKFDTRSRPEHVSQEAFVQAKAAVIDLCVEFQLKFIVHIILHDIIKSQDLDQQVEWAADYVIGRYNLYLQSTQSYGICLVDNLPVKAQFRYLSHKYSTGLSMAAGGAISLDRIKLFGATCANASNVSSAMDIILGSFRYCINNPKNPDAARSMIRKVVSLMWGDRDEKGIHVLGKGLILRPENILFKPYKDEYDQIIDHINGLLASGPD